MKLAFYSLLSVTILFEVVGDIFLKQWTRGNRSSVFMVGVALYVAATLFWAFSLRYDFLSRAISLFMVSNMLAVVLAGILIFGEQLSLANKIGIGFGVVSLILLGV